MTVTYSLDVSASSIINFNKLLFRWKGSLWKGVYQELIIWLVCYGVLSIIYRTALDGQSRRLFEDIVVYCYTYSEFIPITFMLGFYVSMVIGRWWEIFNCLGWIDTPAIMIATYVKGSDENGRMIRRTCVRHLVLMQAMVLRDVSSTIRKRFPTMAHLIAAGLMTENEREVMDNAVSPHPKYWLPCEWVFAALKKAREEQRIESDHYLIAMLEKINVMRLQVATLACYDWVPVPLLYTQVVNLAVLSYFVVALMGRQYLLTERDIPNASSIDLYIPVLSVMQFIFYVGWLKVAQALLNPLGEDDDDFECDYMIDRNLQVGLCVVDDAQGKLPVLERDRFWDDKMATPLYTTECAERSINPLVGSCAQAEEDSKPEQPPGDIVMIKRRKISTSNPSLVQENDFEQAIGHKKRRMSTVSGASFLTSARSSFRRQSLRMSDFIKRKVLGLKSHRDSIKSVSNASMDGGYPVNSSIKLPSNIQYAANTPTSSFSGNISRVSSQCWPVADNCLIVDATPKTREVMTDGVSADQTSDANDNDANSSIIRGAPSELLPTVIEGVERNGKTKFY